MYLVDKKKKLVNEKQRFVNQIINNLKQYYPQVIDWFPKNETNIFCNFISRWPSLQQVQKASRTMLQSFFNDNHIRSPEKVEERINEVKSALPLTDDEAVINVGYTGVGNVQNFYVKRLLNEPPILFTVLIGPTFIGLNKSSGREAPKLRKVN